MKNTKAKPDGGARRTGAGGLLLACVLLATGCSGKKDHAPASYQDVLDNPPAASRTSSAPALEDPPAFAQLRAQAADHWRDMAVEVAQRVYKAYAERDDLLARPIYLAMPNNRPFTVAFYNLLRTELVSRGMQISYSKEPRGGLLEYFVQTVPFDDRRFNRVLSHLGEERGSNHEIIVNARLSYNNRFVMHCSSIRYINDADLRLYADPQAADPLAESSRRVSITEK
ncbi:MAG: hypothetical protein LBD82_07815 [Deltaproteobacteria bacterium]|jgi:hypothetical protein|nr:hypothetical protein [Deltaproteobacteria bacterium]